MSALTRRHKVCVHEAGHAVCAWLLGKSYGCQIHGTGDASAGLAGTGDLSTPPKAEDYADPKRFEPCYKGDPLSAVLTDGTITAAGSAAVGLAQGDMHPIVTPGDNSMVTAGCNAQFPDADFAVERAWVSLCLARALALLRFNMAAVHAVAQRLDTTGRLSADEVRQTIEATSAGA